MSRKPEPSRESVMIENPRVVFDALGDVHDSGIAGFEWRGTAAMLHLTDLYAAFYGWPGYPGPTPGAITFNELRSLTVDIEPPTGATGVYSLEVRAAEGEAELAVELNLAPGGSVRIRCMEIRGDFDAKAVVAAVPKEA